MRRVLPVLLPLVLLAACEGDAAPPSASPDPGNQLRASFPKGGLVDTIEIDAIERLPLRAAELVSADGRTTPASHIDVTASPTVSTGQRVAGDPWETALAGRGSAAVLTMPNAQTGAALRGEQQLLATVATADIALPDPVAYRRDWRKYRIRLTFGTPPGEMETREIAAPEPPPPES
ncbi:MAG TPA: hypothetical protein VGS13_14605 [Stellaceae bacterium]|nr:hypothetical protein [Stellaceae bacterium]